MVDVTPKETTHRRALARCKVQMLPETTVAIASNAINKGDVLGASKRPKGPLSSSRSVTPSSSEGC